MTLWLEKFLLEAMIVITALVSPKKLVQQKFSQSEPPEKSPLQQQLPEKSPLQQQPSVNP